MQKRLPGVVLLKKIFLKTGKFQRKPPVLESHFNKVAGLRPSAQLFSREISEIFNKFLFL